MFNLIGEFHPEKIVWADLKTHLLGVTKVFCVAWVTTAEWDDTILPMLVSNAIDRLQASLTAASEIADGKPIRFGAALNQFNGPPIFGMLPPVHTSFDVRDELTKQSFNVSSVNELAVMLLQLSTDLPKDVAAIKALLAPPA